jgi:hypothetical protein
LKNRKNNKRENKRRERAFNIMINVGTIRFHFPAEREGGGGEQE